MRVGLFGARADRRGLAVQTGEFARHMRPAKVWGLDLTSDDRSPYPCDWRDYEGLDLTVTTAAEVTPERVRAWLRGLDVVFGAETFYRDEFPLWAREVRVPTVLQVNPEFFRHEREPDLPRPDLIVAPTRWRLDEMPGVEHLPFPVDRGRCAYVARPLAPDDEPLTFLHVAGHHAALDRNGRSSVLAALRYVHEPCRLIIRSQSPMPPGFVSGRRGRVDIEVRTEDAPDYWTAYDDADVLVFPRRYGGQALPVNEAMSCGLPVIATDVDPQRDWLPPVTLVQARRARKFQTQAGPIFCHDADPQALAAAMDTLSRDRDLVRVLSEKAGAHASSISWEAMRPTYDALLERVVGSAG